MRKQLLKSCIFSLNEVFRIKAEHLSFEAKCDYLHNLKHMFEELHHGGHHLADVYHVKEKHARFLVSHWQNKGLGTATIKNRLSQLRYLFNLVDKSKLLPKENSEFGIGQRSYIATENRAIYEIDISKFENTLVAYSVQLQQHFGLRREEAIKFDVSYADMGERIRLQPSWTKGGVYREIPITTLEQRALLDELKLKVGSGSLIPKAKKYGYQKRVYDNAVAKSGYKNLHGLRHAYAQRRYFEITNQRTSGNGWHAPFSGGKHRDELSPTERKVDNEARRILSRELGHSRKQIVSVYCGV